MRVYLGFWSRSSFLFICLVAMIRSWMQTIVQLIIEHLYIIIKENSVIEQIDEADRKSPKKMRRKEEKRMVYVFVYKNT